MNAFASVILAVQMLAALGMIGLILIQHGKGADMGASFGMWDLLRSSAEFLAVQKRIDEPV
jgi:protein translocase SecG subunit